MTPCVSRNLIGTSETFSAICKKFVRSRLEDGIVVRGPFSIDIASIERSPTHIILSSEASWGFA